MRAQGTQGKGSSSSNPPVGVLQPAGEPRDGIGRVAGATLRLACQRQYLLATLISRARRETVRQLPQPRTLFLTRGAQCPPFEVTRQERPHWEQAHDNPDQGQEDQ